jgi:hypothetical protein
MWCQRVRAAVMCVDQRRCADRCAAFHDYNTTQMIVVDNGDHKVIICAEAELSNSEYLDAVSKVNRHVYCVLDVLWTVFCVLWWTAHPVLCFVCLLWLDGGFFEVDCSQYVP